jgi:hypothetical protein
MMEKDALRASDGDAPADDGAVFFSRCRPQDSDLVDIILWKRLIFVGVAGVVRWR